MRSRRLFLLTSASMDGFAGRRARTIDRPAPAPAGEQVAALSAAGSTPPRAVIDKLDLRIGRRYRVVHHVPDGRQFAVRGAYLDRLPALDANQVQPWSGLENAGAPVTVRRFGMLFDDRQPDGNKTEKR
jgi:hypothetical protein